MAKPFLIIAALVLCASGALQPARAALELQPMMAAACRPAAPATYTLERWKRACPTGDCFSWRLVCSNGTSHELHSVEHPGTTELESALYRWAPWSFALYLLPFLLCTGLALLGAERVLLLGSINALFLGYFLAAGMALYASVTGNPWAAGAEAVRLLFLNSYACGAMLITFLVINSAAILRGLESLFFIHPPHPAQAPMMMLAHPLHAANAARAFMPDLYEFVDPAQTADYYRRETELLKAQRDKLDAQRSFAETYIRMHRTLNESHE